MSLSELKLSMLHFDDPSVKSLCQALEVNSTRQTLHLGGFEAVVVEDSHCLTQTQLQMLGKCLGNNKGLVYLDLSNNVLELDALESLMSGLHKNSSLKTLNLTSCSINDDGMQVIGAMLPGCKGLETLELWHNNSNSTKVKSILNGLKTNTSLTTVGLSCGGYGGSKYREVMDFYLRRNLYRKRCLSGQLSMSLWPLALEKLTADVDFLYCILREEPDLLALTPVEPPGRRRRTLVRVARDLLSKAEELNNKKRQLDALQSNGGGELAYSWAVKSLVLHRQMDNHLLRIGEEERKDLSIASSSTASKMFQLIRRQRQLLDLQRQLISVLEEQQMAL